MKINIFIASVSIALIFSACESGSSNTNTDNNELTNTGASSSSSIVPNNSSQYSCEDSITQNTKTYSVKSNIVSGDIEHNCKLTNDDGAYTLTKADSFIVTDLKIISIGTMNYVDGELVELRMYDDGISGVVTYDVTSTKYGSVHCEDTYFIQLPVEAFNDIYSSSHIDDVLFGYTQDKMQTTTCPSWVKAEEKTFDDLKSFLVTETIQITDSNDNKYEINTLTEYK